MHVAGRLPALPLACGSLAAALACTGRGTISLCAAAIILAGALAYCYRRGTASLFWLLVAATITGGTAYVLRSEPLPEICLGKTENSAVARVEYVRYGLTGATAPVTVTAVDGTACRPFRALLTAGDCRLCPGQYIRFTGHFRPADEFRGIPHMALSEYARRSERLAATVCAQPYTVHVTGTAPALQYHALDFRQRLEEAVYGSSLSPGGAALLSAALLGTGEAPQGVKQAFRDNAMSHLLCVSGFHVALVAGIFSLLLWPLSFLGRARRLRIPMLLLMVWAYTSVTGLQPAAIRASIMISVFLGARMFQVKGHAFNSLLAATGIMLCVNPYWLWSAGFQLSVSAVGGILVFARPLNFIADRRSAAYKITECSAVPLAAGIGTLPVVLLWFHRVPLYSVPLNAAASLLFPLFIYTGIACVICGTSSIATALSRVADEICNAIMRLCGLADGADAVSDIYLSTGEFAAICLLVAALAAYARISHPGRRRMALGIAAAACIVLPLLPGNEAEAEVVAAGDNRGCKLFIIAGDSVLHLSAGRPALASLPGEYLRRRNIATAPASPQGMGICGNMRAGVASRIAVAGSAPKLDYLIIDRKYKGELNVAAVMKPGGIVLIGADVREVTVRQVEAQCRQAGITVRHMGKRAYYWRVR